MLRAGHVVFAAGAWFRHLALQAGDRVPLDTERGYHVRFAEADTALTRPVGWMEGGFYLTPMDDGLRVAGTVELGGLRAPPTPARFAVLENGGAICCPSTERTLRAGWACALPCPAANPWSALRHAARASSMPSTMAIPA